MKLTWVTLFVCAILYAVTWMPTYRRWWDRRKLDRIVAKKLDEQFGR